MNPESTTTSQKLEFEVFFRKAGASPARQLRKKQQVPAIVYGPNQKPITLALDIRAIEKYSKKEYENKIFTFKSDNTELNGLKVLKKDISYHKLTRSPLHIDFLSLDMNKKVRVHVDVHFTGKAKGVKESGGVFSVIRRNVEVECMPSEIPDSFSIDISPLNINQNFHVSDLQIPENIKLITSPKSSLCTVSEITEEETKAQPTEEGEKTTTTEPPSAGKTSSKSEDKKENSANKK